MERVQHFHSERADVPAKETRFLKTAESGRIRKTMTHRTTRLINPHTGELQCKICGTSFFSREKPLLGEDYYDKEYHCPNGCTHSGDVFDKTG
jgi:hypothetical protein